MQNLDRGTGTTEFELAGRYDRESVNECSLE